MKKLAMIVVVLLTALAFGSGCATLGWKPSEDQLLQYEQTLGMANFTEAGLYVVLDSLCGSAILNEAQCKVGYAADTEWDNAYTLAMGAIADYRAGKTDIETMQKLVSAATASAIRITKLIKELLGSKPSTVKAQTAGKAMAKPPTKK